MHDKWLLLRGNNPRYWGSVFIVFVLSYFFPVGSQAGKVFFYLFIFFPALLGLRYADLLLLSRSAPFWFLLALCSYAILHSVDFDNMLHGFKITAAIFSLLIVALRLPSLPPERVKRVSLVFIFVLVVYVLMNAISQYFYNGWVFGQRLAPLFGQSKSVIFTADLLMSALVTYSWSCIKTRCFRYVFFANIAVAGVALALLQTRSVIPVWIVCSSVLMAIQIRNARHLLMAVGFAALAGAGVWLVLSLFGMAHSVTARGDSYRFEIWTAYFFSTIDCGIIAGCGWGREFGFIARDGSAIAHPHSMYMQHFYWGGLIGLLLLLACIAVPLIKGISSSNYAAWPLLAGSVALAFDGKSLISLPNERWLLVLLPLVVLIGDLARLQKEKSCLD